jgi:hypothetical protein
VILPKSCNKDEKDRSENWKPITLTDIFDRIIVDIITDYFQVMNELKRINGAGIVCKE